ncbi:MAG: DNA polymerase I [Oscillospiraceae bacterium]|nr:DNA polymerase I [Oscillospiraceae bacterium]
MKLLILDGNSILNRAFYGVRLLSTRAGEYTNAIFGFLNILQKLLDDEKPDALCVAFDRKAPTFRHLQYEGYKATRHPMPEELAQQLPVMKDVLTAMRVPIFELDGWEADDVIGTVGRICCEKNWSCVIATGDRDSLQLVNDCVTVRLAVSQQGQTLYTAYTPEVFTEEYGFAPRIMIDLKALMGDSSDNIPGVAGIGPKTAKELLWKFGSLDGVYAALESGNEAIRGAVKTKLENGKDSAYLSYDLATIRLNAPIDFAPENCLRVPPDEAALYALFLRLEFTKMIERYQLHPQAAPAAPQQTVAAQEVTDEQTALSVARSCKTVAAANNADLSELALFDGKTAYHLSGGAVSDAVLRALYAGGAEKIVAQSKELRRALLARGIEAESITFDAAVAAYLLDPTQSEYDTARLTMRYLGVQLAENDLAAEAEAVFELQKTLSAQLQKENLTGFYTDVELPLCKILAEMEHVGIRVDRAALEAFGKMLTERIEADERLIFGYAEGEFNIQSTKQLGEVLFEKLCLPPVKKTKTGYATGAEILEKLKNVHPIIPAILDYRMLTKLRSTYADGLLKVIAADGRVHTTFQNTVTATGRLSSTDPNLQNIPVRTEMGSEIRKMFLPREGWLLVDADYSQIELRVLAHVADDRAMQEAFLSGEDFHAATAAQIYDVPISAVTHEMRRSAKAVNFGVVYGISGFSLAEDIGVSRAEATAFIDAYLRRFSGVANYRKQIVADAYRDGYVSTLFGRKRVIPELKNSNHMIKAAGERIALNTPIQGTAADIMKIAMVRTAEALKRENLQARLLLQVHDELIVECPPEEKDRVIALLQDAMQGAAELRVPLLTEAHAGESWLAAK